MILHFNLGEFKPVLIPAVKTSRNLFENLKSMVTQYFYLILKGKYNFVLFPCNFSSNLLKETAETSHPWVKRPNVLGLGENKAHIKSCRPEKQSLQKVFLRANPLV